MNWPMSVSTFQIHSYSEYCSMCHALKFIYKFCNSVCKFSTLNKKMSNPIDNRIVKIIEGSIASKHRFMFFVCGPTARDQVGFLHHTLAKCRQEAKLPAPSILWCYKKDVPFSDRYHKKRLKKLHNTCSNDSALRDNDVKLHFLLSSNPHFCHYSEADRILGQTFGMLVAQDLEALTPNYLAQITECVEGGGLVIFLLPIPITQLGDMHMDAHEKFATESHPHVSPLFNHRLVKSLASCSGCMVLDDELQVKMEQKPKLSFPAIDLSSLLVIPDTLTESENSIYQLCCTTSQISSLQSLHKALDSSDAKVVSLSSGRGRGKSAILGLGVALGINRGGPMHVVVTSPHYENLKSFFDFIGRGLDAVGFTEGEDYHLVKDASGVTTSIRISHMGKRGRVVYHTPMEHHVVASADLLVIDEAAAIPLPLVKGWLRQGLTTFMASTIHGYEGTGRSLSLKLLKELRNPYKETDHILEEVNLTEPIRYTNGDPIEEWINQLLCLEASEDRFLDRALPPPDTCQLYGVNRTALFNCSVGSEVFLHNLVSLFVVSHYRNSPSDILMMADAPAHRIFCLVGEGAPHTPLCAIQIALEGGISFESSQSEQAQGKRSAGDLIPWTISQQFQDNDFPSLLGARIVRIATHPSYLGMGYGRRALALLSEFYSSPKNPDCETGNKNELLWDLELLKEDGPLDYLGVSYGITSQLFNFWKRAGFVPLYIRQTTSEVTGEHTCVMIKNLGSDSPWLQDFSFDFLSRFCPLLPTAFRKLPSQLVIQVLQSTSAKAEAVHEDELRFICTPRSMLRLGAYCRREVDYHLIRDLMPTLAPLLLMGRLQHTKSRYTEECVLVAFGLQWKSVDVIAQEIPLDPPVILGIFRKAVNRIFVALQKVYTV